MQADSSSLLGSQPLGTPAGGHPGQPQPPRAQHPAGAVAPAAASREAADRALNGVAYGVRNLRIHVFAVFGCQAHCGSTDTMSSALSVPGLTGHEASDRCHACRQQTRWKVLFVANMRCPPTQAMHSAPAGSPWTPSSRDVPPSVAQSWSGGHTHQQPQHAGAPPPIAVLRTEHVASSPRAGGQSVQSPHGAGQPFYLPQPQQQWQHMAHLQTQQHPSPAGFHPLFAGHGYDAPGRPFGMPVIGPQHGFNPAYQMMDFQRHASMQGSQASWPHAPQQPVSPQVRAGLPQHPGLFSPVPAAHNQQFQQQQGAFGHDTSPAPPQQPQHGVFGHVPPPGWQPTRPTVPGIAGQPPPIVSAQVPQQPAPVHNAPQHAQQHAPQQQPQHLLRGADRSGSAGSGGSQAPAPLAGSESGKLLLSMLQRNASAGSARSTASAQSTPSAAVPAAAAEGAGATPTPLTGQDAPSAAHAAARAAMGSRSSGRQHLQQGRGSPAAQGAGSHAGRHGGGRGGAQPGRAPASRGGGAGDAGRRGGGPGRHAPKVVPI